MKIKAINYNLPWTLIIFSLVFYIYGCVSVDKEAISFIGKNPTSYVFNKNIADMHGVINELIKDNNFQFHKQVPLKPYKTGIHLFKIDNTKKYDEYKHIDTGNYDIVFTIETWLSDVYRYNDKPTPTNAVFHLILKSVGKGKTKVTVKVDSMEVLTFPLANSEHGSIPFRKKVKSTSIEEYVVLFYLGKYLGVDMPEIKRPSEFIYLNELPSTLKGG